MNDPRILRLETRISTAHNARRAIYDKVNRSGRDDLTTAEDTEFRALTEDIAQLEARKAELCAEIERSSNVTDSARTLRSSRTDAAEQAAAGWLPGRRAYHEQEQEQRATGYSNAGAVLLTEQYNGWFDRLRNRSVILQAGPRLVPVPGHALSVPIVNTSATVSNYDENTQISASDPDLDPLVLTPVKFAALVLASNESMNDSNPELVRIVGDDLIKTTSTAVDAAFLAGPGGTGPVKILGLRNKPGVTDTGNTLLGVNGAVPDLDTFASMLTLLEGVGSSLEKAAFFVTPGVWGVMRKIKRNSEAANYALQPDVTSAARPSLFGVPVYVTANLPQTEVKGTSGSTTSTIVLADMDRVLVGVGQDVTVVQSQDFAFDRDQTAIRVTARFDIQVLDEEAVIVAKGAKLA